VKDSDVSPILDFRMTLTSIPSWMAIYSSAETGCVHNILATLRVDDSRSNYNDFTRNLCSILPKMQWDGLKKVFFSFLFYISLLTIRNFGSHDEALTLWNERSAPP
jgi:hypothetical protein